MPTFLKKFALAFEKFFGFAPSWIHFAQTVISFAVPVATAVIAGFAPELTPIAGPIMAEVQADLATASVLVGEGDATPSLVDAINRIQGNLNALMSAGHIKDASTQAKVQLVVGELAALVGMLPKSAAAPAPTTSAA